LEPLFSHDGSRTTDFQLGWFVLILDEHDEL